MSIDCGQFSGLNNCRFSGSASSYSTLEDAYSEPNYPSPALALFDYCPKGKNPSEINSIPFVREPGVRRLQRPAEGRTHRRRPAGRPSPPAAVSLSRCLMKPLAPSKNGSRDF
jgi:hypothetical protein